MSTWLSPNISGIFLNDQLTLPMFVKKLKPPLSPMPDSFFCFLNGAAKQGRCPGRQTAPHAPSWRVERTPGHPPSTFPLPHPRAPRRGHAPTFASAPLNLPRRDGRRETVACHEFLSAKLCHIVIL